MLYEIKNLSKTYQNHKSKIFVFKNINLSLNEKGLVLLLGKSGSGKSTLINMLSLSDIEYDGEIIIRGDNIKTMKSQLQEHERCYLSSMIFQDYNLVDKLNVKDNILMINQMMDVHPSMDEYEKILRQLKIKELELRFPFELSSGQKQRVAIARTLLKNPQVIFADEPTGALDSENGLNIACLLKEISKERLVVVVSHDEALFSSLSDEIYTISQCQITQIKTQKCIDNFSPIKDEKKEKQKKNIWSLLDYTFKSAFHSIGDHFMSIVLVVISFVLLSSFYFITQFNKDDYAIRFFNHYQHDEIVIDKTDVFMNDYFEASQADYIKMKNSDLLLLQRHYEDYHFYPIYDELISIRYYNNEETQEYEFNGCIAIDNQLIIDSKFAKIRGEYPSDSIDDGIEIVISNYIAMRFVGVELVNTHYEKIKILSIDDLISFKFYSGGVQYKIVGIIDTDQTYPEIFETDSIASNEIVYSVFMNKSLLEEMYDISENKITAKNQNRDYYTGKFIGDDSNDYHITNIYKLEEQSDIHYLSSDLYSESIVVSKKTLLNLLYPLNDFSEDLNEFILNYCQNHFNFIQSDFELDYGPSNYEEYYDYILHHNDNPYEPNATYERLSQDKLQSKINESSLPIFQITDSKYNIIFSIQFTVVGYFDNYITNEVYVSDAPFNAIKSYNDGNISRVYTTLKGIPQDRQLIADVLKTDTVYRMVNADRQNIENVASTVSNFTDYSLILIVGLSLIFVFTLGYTSYINFSKNEKTYLLFYKIGMRKKKLLYLVILRNTLYLLVLIPFVLCFSKLFLFYVNRNLFSSFSYQVDVLIYQAQFVLLLFLFYSIGRFFLQIVFLNRNYRKQLGSISF